MKMVLLFFVLTALPALAQEALPLSQSLIEDLEHPPAPGLNANDIRPTSKRALRFIADYEQWRPDFYDDAAGYCTIGYGHLIARGPCRVHAASSGFSPLLEPEFGIQLLDQDVLTAREAVSDEVAVPLNEGQYDALVSFTFNVGKGAFRKSTLLKRLNDGLYDEAADQMRLWVNAGGKRLKGLARRRACERAIFLGVAPLSSNGAVNRAACEQGVGLAEISEDDAIDILVGEP